MSRKQNESAVQSYLGLFYEEKKKRLKNSQRVGLGPATNMNLDFNLEQFIE